MKKILANKKILLLILIILTLSISMTAVTSASLFKNIVTTGNIFRINTGEKYQNSALTGWYPVEKWEVETCTRGQTSDFKIADQAAQGAFARENLIVDMTLTLQGKQHNIRPDYKQYEIAWYVHPFSTEVSYTLEYKTNNNWKEFNPPQTGTAGPQQGNQGYFSWDGTYNITEVRIKANNSYLDVPVVYSND